MNVLIIPDKFKGSLTAAEAIEAIRLGLCDADARIQTHSIKASDGGDGFLDAVCASRDSIRRVPVESVDPLGRPIEAAYGFDEASRTAYIEMAKASGMECLTPGERNPMLTSTDGTGRLIRDAIRRGAEQVYVGLGGSATNDGGTGIAAELGYHFFDGAGRPVTPNGAGLSAIRRIERPADGTPLQSIRVYAINDVGNPLVGDEGAAAVYAPQKGADPEMVRVLDAGLANLSRVVQRDLGIDAANVPGAGAAGGTGYGLKVFLNAEFLSGIEFVLSLTGMEPLLAGGTIDAIITGEGRIDDQTAYGKLVRGVSDVGRKYDVPVYAICGLNDLKRSSAEQLGLQAIIQLHDRSRPVEETIGRAGELLRQAAGRIFAQGDSNAKQPVENR